MSSEKLKFELNDQTLHFDFDEWAALSREDPEGFEKRRIEWSQQLIKNAPPTCRRRLSGLLFQINMEKRRSANAMDSCLRLSRLMWDKFHQLRGELHGLALSPDGRVPVAATTVESTGSSARVIDFSQIPLNAALAKSES